MAQEHKNCAKIMSLKEFDDMLEKSNEQFQLVDFYADWCPPCVSLKPRLLELAEEFNGGFQLAICNCDIEELGAKASFYKVSGIPHVMLMKNGEVVEQFVGGKSKADVEAFLTANGVTKA